MGREGCEGGCATAPQEAAVTARIGLVCVDRPREGWISRRKSVVVCNYFPRSLIPVVKKVLSPPTFERIVK
jgi:hypothetical protein